MNEKIFFITIPMQKPEDLRALRYRKEDKGGLYSEPSAFPGIVLLSQNILGNEDSIKIHVLLTDDAGGRSRKNYERFIQELDALSEEIGIKLSVTDEIILSHSENRQKQIDLLKSLCACFSDDAEVYMDVTYGTKITSIGMFTSLVYAERVKNCKIKTVAYGKNPHDGSDVGEFYDVSCMYEISMLIHAADYMPSEQIDELLRQLWG